MFNYRKAQDRKDIRQTKKFSYETKKSFMAGGVKSDLTVSLCPCFSQFKDQISEIKMDKELDTKSCIKFT